MTPVARFSWGVLGVGIVVSGCGGGPKEGWNNYSSDAFLPLGFEQNQLDLRAGFYAGHHARRLQLQFQLVTDDTQGAWVPGITIQLSVMTTGLYGFPAAQVVQTISAQPLGSGTDGTFWTPVIVGNWVGIHITSTSPVQVGHPAGALLIRRVKVDWDASYSKDAPQSSLVSLGPNHFTAMPLGNNGELTSFLVGANGTHYYWFNPPNTGTYSVYVSPYVWATDNDNGIVLGMSTNGFVQPTTGLASAAGKYTPEPLDRGIYEELQLHEGQILYLTVRGVIGGAYTISVNEQATTFHPVIEMDEHLPQSGAQTLNLAGYRRPPAWTDPHANREADFLRANGTYLQRLIEVLTLASANMLAASEGYMRFDGADIFLSEHWWLNSDIEINDADDRPYTSPTKINLFRNQLNKPLEGGRLLHHEWGHLEYDLEDEYADLQPGPSWLVADWNTVMNGPQVFQGHIAEWEFCGKTNHRWTTGLLGLGGIGDEDANWVTIGSKYDLDSPDYPSAHGQYHDVLKKLYKLMTFNYYK